MKLLPHARMAAILLWSTAAVATAQTGPRVMTNDDIIQLVKLGMSPDIVSAAIKGAGRTEFDVSPSGLTKLKEARVPDPAVVAMIGVGTTLDPNDVATPRDPGIYIDVGESAVCQSIPMTGGGHGGRWAPLCRPRARPGVASSCC